jgi:catechol 2,3-dioxygenase-like lactoylglutathione lyase family enzyme
VGIHHITAIAGNPDRNLRFYARTLGLRLVKLTVNYDDPATYHFYFGDELGRPGTILTFFPSPPGSPGRLGTGQVAAIGFAIPPASLGFWIERLLAQGVRHQGPSRRFDEPVLTFADPDGLPIELIATERVRDLPGWADGPVPAEQAIRGLHGATIWEDGETGTAELLTGQLGFRRGAEEGTILRLEAGEGPGMLVDLRRAPGFWRGAGGVGTVHHIAVRAADPAEQLGRREALEAAGYQVTPVLDRTYFRSIYFREPGGVLFEVATDGPGFTVDESAAELGSSLQLPGQLQPVRDRIAAALPPVVLASSLQRTAADPWP